MAMVTGALHGPPSHTDEMHSEDRLDGWKEVTSFGCSGLRKTLTLKGTLIFLPDVSGSFANIAFCEMSTLKIRARAGIFTEMGGKKGIKNGFSHDLVSFAEIY